MKNTTKAMKPTVRDIRLAEKCVARVLTHFGMGPATPMVVSMTTLNDIAILIAADRMGKPTRKYVKKHVPGSVPKKLCVAIAGHNDKIVIVSKTLPASKLQDIFDRLVQEGHMPFFREYSTGYAVCRPAREDDPPEISLKKDRYIEQSSGAHLGNGSKTL